MIPRDRRKVANDEMLQLHKELLETDARIVDTVELELNPRIAKIKEFLGEERYELISPIGIRLVTFKPHQEQRFNLERFKWENHALYSRYLELKARRPFIYGGKARSILDES